jgi:hypothetical protein
MEGHAHLIDFVQQPVAYGRSPTHGVSATTTIGLWSGRLWHDGNQAGFEFETGQSAQGQNIIASVWGMSGYTEDDIRQFVGSLDFTSTPRRNY